MPTPTRFCVALQTRKSARAGEVAQSAHRPAPKIRSGRVRRLRSPPAKPIPNPFANHISISRSPFQQTPGACQRAVLFNSNRFRKARRAIWLPIRDFLQKPWPNNGIAPASSSCNDDTIPHGYQRTDRFLPMTRSTVFAPFDIVEGDRKKGVVLLADHARRDVPDEYGSLGLPAAEFERHIAYDIGVETVTRELAAALDAPAVLAGFSRLLIDPNRGEDDPTLIRQLYDGTIVPGNYPMAAEEREKRLDRLYRPYH